jgi:hypothetical protein
MSPTEDFAGRRPANRTQFIFRLILVFLLIGVAAEIFITVSFFRSATPLLLAIAKGQENVKEAMQDLEKSNAQTQLQVQQMIIAQSIYNAMGESRQKNNHELVEDMRGLVADIQKHQDEQDRAQIQRIARADEDRKDMYAKINNAVDTMTDMMQDAISAAHTATKAARSAESQSHTTQRRVEQRLPKPTPKPWFHFP